jgi:uncharacterized membrane protein
MSIERDLKSLQDAQVISAETAEAIRGFYRNKGDSSQNRLLIVFGVLGALLIGLGIILMLAHNWDELGKPIKTVFCFLPLLIGQALCFYTLRFKSESAVMRESSATFLFFAVGASISLVSQIYHLNGNLANFILVWMVLAIPIIFLLRSSVVALLYVIGITWFACEAAFDQGKHIYARWYYVLLLFALLHYYMSWKRNSTSNALTFLHWFVPISLTITLGILAHHAAEWVMLTNIMLFSLFSLIGDQTWLKDRSVMVNGYAALGSLGSVVLLLVLSFSSYWIQLRGHESYTIGVLDSEVMSSLLLFVLCALLFYKASRSSKWNTLRPASFLFMIMPFLFYYGFTSNWAPALVNVLILAIGLITLKQGTDRNHLGVVNYGLLITTALIMCRFFDTDISFVIRGLLFVLVGAGFFMANYFLIKKRRQSEK